MVSIVINVAIAVISVWAWLSIMLGRGDDATLALHGVRSLKYYTVLSNLFSAAVSGLYLAVCLLPGIAAPQWLLILKLMATTVVMVTFLTTAILLGPVFGWGPMYRGGNLWLHLVLPLAALADVCLLVPIGLLPLQATLYSVAFTAIYAVFYLRPVLRYGAERDGVTYDFYGFLRWGRDKIWIVAAGMLSATWLISLALWGLARVCQAG